MQTPMAPGWAFVVVLIDAAVLVGAAVAALLVVDARRRAAAQGGRWGLVVAAALLGWLALALALGGAHVFESRSRGVPWIGLGVAAPIIVGLVAFRASPGLRRIIGEIPQPWLLAAQTPRLVGAIFLVLLAQHRLPADFAVPAGVGDILVGAAAPFVAFAYAARRPWSRGLALVFNLAGIADFVVAVGTGFFTSPTPFRLFFSQPSTVLMTVLPLVLIPTFLVPLLTLIHAASLRGLLSSASAPANAAPRWTPGMAPTWNR